jgi:flagellar basal body rod protein FlgG
VNVGLYHGVGAMVAAERRLEAVAQNLANVSTPAYKRVTAGTQAKHVGQAGRGFLGTSTARRVDFAQGELERTGAPYDLALLGEGYFTVEGARGPVYTRSGSLRVDDRGVLQTADGRMVAWKGSRGRIEPTGEPVTIDLAGFVHQGARRVGQLDVTAFADESRLVLGRDGYWRADAALERVPAEAEVHQGALERSNVNAVEELVELITIQRSFESASSLMDQIDHTYRRLNESR